MTVEAEVLTAPRERRWDHAAGEVPPSVGP